MRISLHLQRRFGPCMNGKPHLFLECVKAAGPLDGITGTFIGTLAYTAYPAAFLVLVHQLLVGTLSLQPSRDGNSAQGPHSEQTVYFAAEFTSHTCEFSAKSNPTQAESLFYSTFNKLFLLNKDFYKLSGNGLTRDESRTSDCIRTRRLFNVYAGCSGYRVLIVSNEGRLSDFHQSVDGLSHIDLR